MSTTQTRKGYFSHPEHKVVLAAFSVQRLPGDRMVLSDDVMEAALEGRKCLQPTQWQALLSSPLTLCRLRYLEGCRLAALSRHGRVNEVDDGRVSRYELLAATSTETDISLYSPDGRWALHALTTRTVTRLLLQLLPQAEDGIASTASRPVPGDEVAVLDGAGFTLLMGRLDADGELEQVWNQPLDLQSRLVRYGRSWSVVRA